jgi:hypothetical protein
MLGAHTARGVGGTHPLYFFMFYYETSWFHVANQYGDFGGSKGIPFIFFSSYNDNINLHQRREKTYENARNVTKL